MDNKEYQIFTYDKFDDDHSFNNIKTLNINIKDIERNFELITDLNAVIEYNKFGGIYTLPENLNLEFYNILLYKKNLQVFTFIKISYKILKDYIINDKEIPNKDFFHILIYYDLSYNACIGNIEKNKIENIINEIKKKTGDITDQMIENTDILNCKLYDYQKRSINWMLDKEIKKNIIYLSDDTIINDICYNNIERKIYITESFKNILKFKGGALIDEVGLGKTIQILTLAMLNQAKDCSYYREESNMLYSRATLIICPSQLCGQWKREIENKFKSDQNINIIMLLTKVHLEKYTYLDLLDADFVIVSFSYLDNKHYLKNWLSKISTKQNYQRSSYTTNQFAEIKNLLYTMNDDLVSDFANIEKVNTVLPLIHWHRLIVDEIHEAYTIEKNIFVSNQIPLIKSQYRWCLSGTPFDKNGGLMTMLCYVTENIQLDTDIIQNAHLVNYIENNLCRRNTKESVTIEFKLPPIKERVIWLNFSQTESMMYNAFRFNNNIDKYSVLLRKICCHPTIAGELKDQLSNCMTLNDIQKKMVSCYKTSMDDSKTHLDNSDKKIKIWNNRIRIYEIKRQVRILRDLGYFVILNVTGLIEDETLSDDDIEIDQEETCINNKSGKPFTITDENNTEILKIIGNKRWMEKRVTLDIMYQKREKENEKQNILLCKYNNNRVSYEFYSTVIDKINKTRNKSENDDEEVEICIICLDDINENNIGLTSCGHLFCFNCIRDYVLKSSKCPKCSKKIFGKNLNQISYEMKKKDINPDLKDKNDLIDKIGTKLGNLIFFLKSNNKHTIIFSQWEDLLIKVGSVLDNYGIGNIFCKGNPSQRNSAILKFSSDNSIRVIMLSSSVSASGANLTKASQVIILDPIVGSYEFRKNTEWQSIGRAHRIGQTAIVEVIRFIIKNTIEEEIYIENKSNDERDKINENIPIFEITENDIILSEDKIQELKNIKVKESKVKIIKIKQELEEID
jgi:SNF2 family DNA or RNA helicase